ncbi:hypothetical protein BABINDRAFT_159076 [Babjeviella inositovora NRRL Y-12698]|uniref:Uncharacterized protein n=1 Tax=Babjeviella inositovora NRRL Y-12698 TaxID=984486 RepID=A0A1E3QXV0_9ASCO|nr:uncharacterized protein BABINDRAFT_159076 [Babjeviella inositovora NRRL Y-12698]ODQ82500.1 hypothetical protein BABINDRAFT_159076 [Babjeviella inositovora NRRL Y-12698]
MRNIWKLSGKAGAFVFFSMGVIPTLTCYYMYKTENAIDFRGAKRTESLIKDYVPEKY